MMNLYMHVNVVQCFSLGSLSTRVFETRTATGREQFAFLDRIVSQIFILFISNGEKILSNVNVVVWGQVKSENSSLPVAVRVSKTRVLKLPIRELKQQRRRRRGQRLVKNEFKFNKRSSRWSWSVRYAYGPKNVPRLHMQRRRSIPNGNTKN